jgi:transcriptional regulator with XRE-family HTH domain
VLPAGQLPGRGPGTTRLGAELSAGSFAAQLNHLIATVHRPGGPPYSNKDLADAAQARGVRCTPQYIGQLRAGRHAPSLEMATAIAGIFGVRTDYFSDPVLARRTDEQLAFLAAVQDTGVTAVAMRAAGLSPRGLAALTAVIDQIRAVEGLPPARPAGPEAGQPGV